MSGEKAQRVREDIKWTVIDGDVYDITNYIKDHPGGKKKIIRGIGKDSTEMFYRYHEGLKISNTPLLFLKIGEIQELKEKAERDRLEEELKLEAEKKRLKEKFGDQPPKQKKKETCIAGI